MPHKWRRSVIVPTYKNGSDVQNCTNYCWTNLMSYTLKLCERAMDLRLGQTTMISKNQLGFMQRRSTIEAIFSLR